MIEFVFPLLIPLGLVLLFKFLNKQNKPPMFGIYRRKNKYYWLKFVFMYIILRVKQLYIHLKRLYFVEVGKSCDGTIQVHALDAVLEKKYYLGDNPNGIDTVYFNGMSKEGELITCGIARRVDNVDAFMYLKLKDQEWLLSPALPDTYQEQSSGEKGEYKINGLEIDNFIPMRTWKINYKGEMKLHLTHYQQMGAIEGTVTVDGKQQILNIPCIREHSYGPFQDRNTYHRYVHHYFFLENGDSIAVGSVCQPATFSHLTAGYLCRKSDQVVLPVESCEFQLYQHGENQILPKDYGFLFTAGRERYEVLVQVEDEYTMFIGKAKEAKVYERWGTVVVNGVKGRACIEWLYNNR